MEMGNKKSPLHLTRNGLVDSCLLADVTSAGSETEVSPRGQPNCSIWRTLFFLVTIHPTPALPVYREGVVGSSPVHGGGWEGVAEQLKRNKLCVIVK